MLHASSDDNSEFRFWLTRRFVKLIWPSIVGSLEQTLTIQTQASPEAKKEIFAFEHEKALTDSDFKTPYNETAKETPLGTAPILLVKMQIRRNSDGSLVMALAPEQGPGIDLALNAELLHSLSELISNGARLAEWQLDSKMNDSDDSTKLENATIN